MFEQSPREQPSSSLEWVQLIEPNCHMPNPAETSPSQPLPRTIRREATAALQGYAYQVWVSLDQWMSLPPTSVLFLEGAEDIDRLDKSDADTIQVRRTGGTISLNTEKARTAIAQFWSTRERELQGVGREVRYTYLTTSDVALESNAIFGGRTGIETWSHARFEASSAEVLRGYLLENLDAKGSLLNFLRSAKTEDLQRDLFSNFKWVVNSPDISTVQSTVTDSLATRLSRDNFNRETLLQIRDALIAHCWQKICEQELADRRLTALQLDQVIQNATTIYLAVPRTAMGSVLMAAAHMSSLQGAVHDLSILADEIPAPPRPLLIRSELTALVSTHLRIRDTVLLTGSVHKGKTTIAILSALKVAPDAWWISLSARPGGTVRDIFDFLRNVLALDETPSLIVLDDLDTSPTAKQVYSGALSKLIYRAKSVGKSVLLTAQGDAGALQQEDAETWKVVVVDIASMTNSEIETECLTAGCLPEEVAQWAALIAMQTQGHPKLVQVRIEEISSSGWPAFDYSSFVEKSPAVRNARQLAQSLFADSVSDAHADFVYTLAEFSIYPSREMILKLADAPPGIEGIDGLIRRLTGKWLETVTAKHLRVTPMLKAVEGETWSKERYRLVHRKVFDAIVQCEKLTAREGAALVFHGYTAQDATRTMKACVELIAMTDEAIKQQIHYALTWLIPAGSGNNANIFPWDERTSLMLRQLQFHVCATQEPSRLHLIVRGWKREISETSGQTRVGAELLLNFSILVTQAHLRPSIVLESAKWIHSESEKSNPGVEMFDEFLSQNPLFAIPTTASNFQAFLFMKFEMVADYDDFCELVDWLENESSLELLSEFDDMMSWPLVATNGLFVHMGWINEANLEGANWERWTEILSRAYSIAKTRNISSFGYEISRALSVIYAEKQSDFETSTLVLDNALRDFGPSVVLAEQRSNIYFQASQYEQAIVAWTALVAQFGPTASVDPHAYRRMGLAASKLEKWTAAAMYFEQGAQASSSSGDTPTRCGLLAEAALALHLNNDSASAAKMMVRCFFELSTSKEAQGDSKQWEASIRMYGAIATQVRGHQPTMIDGKPATINPGMASNPLLSISTTDSNQAMRMAMLELDVFVAEAIATGTGIEDNSRFRKLLNHSNPTIRWLTSLSCLVYELETASSAWVVELIELGYSASDSMREKTPFASLKKDPKIPMAGFYVLAAVCDPRPIDDLLRMWESATTGTRFATSQSVFETLRRGMSVAPMTNINIVFNGKSDKIERCAAALTILKSTAYDARSTAGAQAVIALMLREFGALAALNGKGIERRIAKRFSSNWLELVKWPHLLVSPRLTLPPLIIEVELAQRGRGNLKRLLQCSVAATGLPIATVLEVLES